MLKKVLLQLLVLDPAALAADAARRRAHADELRRDLEGLQQREDVDAVDASALAQAQAAAAAAGRAREEAQLRADRLEAKRVCGGCKDGCLV